MKTNWSKWRQTSKRKNRDLWVKTKSLKSCTEVMEKTTEAVAETISHKEEGHTKQQKILEKANIQIWS